MNYKQFRQEFLGSSFNTDGVAGVQCVDIVKLYIREVYNESWRSMGGNGGAYNAYRLFPHSLITEQENWELITNNPSDPSQFPEQGDIIVFDQTSQNIYGHISIYDRTTGVNSFVSIDQNVGGKKVREITHTFTESGGFGKVLGWLHQKKVEPVLGQPIPPEQSDETQSVDNSQKLEGVNQMSGEMAKYLLSSSNKSFYKSKKFIAILIQLILEIVASFYPQLMPVAENTRSVIMAYILGQSVVDSVSPKKILNSIKNVGRKK